MRRQAISSLYERHKVYLHKPRQYSLLHTQAIWYSLLLLGYKPVQHVTVLNTVGNCNTVVSIIILYCNMGPYGTNVVYAVRNDFLQCRAEKGRLKVKVKMPLTKSLRHVGGMELYFHSLLTSALDRGDLSTSRSGRFTPEKRPSYTSKNVARWVPVPEWAFWIGERSPLPGFELQHAHRLSVVSVPTELHRLRQRDQQSNEIVSCYGRRKSSGKERAQLPYRNNRRLAERALSTPFLPVHRLI